MSEEFLLGDEIELRMKSNAHQWDIRPVLMLRKNNDRTLISKGPIPLCLDFVEKGKDQLGNSFGHSVDKGVSFHSRPINILYLIGHG